MAVCRVRMTAADFPHNKSHEMKHIDGAKKLKYLTGEAYI